MHLTTCSSVALLNNWISILSTHLSFIRFVNVLISGVLIRGAAPFYYIHYRPSFRNLAQGVKVESRRVNIICILTSFPGGGGEIVARGVKCPPAPLNETLHYSVIFFSPRKAQPSTFHPDILSLQTPISFHRHRPSDPYLIYRDYLTDTSPDPPPDSAQKKTEL